MLPIPSSLPPLVIGIARPDEEAGGRPNPRGETSSALGAHDHGAGKCFEW